MTLMPNRKPKTPASTGITKHYCLKRQADISLSILPCVTSITQNGKTTTSVYDNANRMTQTTLGNDITKNYTYDVASQLSAITFKKGTATIGDLTYSYDNGGQIIAQNGSLVRTALPPATTANAIYDANNRLTSWNGQAITYDAQGNMLASGGKTFTWDTRNRLTGIAGGTTASFGYYTMGRRITKTVPLTANTATLLTYDGANPVVEKQGATVTGTNLTGAGMDSYLTRKDGATETWPLTDHLGSVIALTDATGAVVTSYTYEPYGTTTQTGTTSTNPHQYTGREKDGTGLYFYRARYYDPQLMRFISEDPIGLAGGVNSYAYVDGDPLGFADPEGLRPNGSGNARQRRRDSRETTREALREAQRVENYYRQRAEQEAWVSSLTRNNRDWGNYGDGLGAVTGGGIAGRHPSVPNAVEIWLDPARRREGLDFVPGIEAPQKYPGNSCP
jgi:RHS repeat-associated protein